MKRIARYAAVPLALAAVVFAGILFASVIHDIGNGSEDKGRLQLERALQRAIATEYASTGAYPGSLADIVEKYGIQIDEKRYWVSYVASGENIAPRLDVIKLGYMGTE